MQNYCYYIQFYQIQVITKNLQIKNKDKILKEMIVILQKSRKMEVRAPKK